MSANEILVEAAKLIERPGAWTQGWFARDSNGAWVSFMNDEGAVSFCVVGAIYKSAGRSVADGDLARRKFEKYLGIPSAVFRSVSNWNDHPNRTQAEVINALREASK